MEPGGPRPRKSPAGPATGAATPPPKDTEVPPDSRVRELPDTPEVAAQVFGDRLSIAARYVEILSDTGISHGLVGPHEAPRLWDRHVLACAVVHPLFEPSTRVADIGSGAGLPGIPLAIVRPDLEMLLVEPLLRRTRWLERVLPELGLDNVMVYRGRAESLWGTARFGHVTARAVARIAELARIALPLLTDGGSLHALKGERAGVELAEDQALVAACGGSRWTVSRHGHGVVDPETVVVSVGVDETPRLPARSHSQAPGRRRAHHRPR